MDQQEPPAEKHPQQIIDEYHEMLERTRAERQAKAAEEIDAHQKMQIEMGKKLIEPRPAKKPEEAK